MLCYRDRAFCSAYPRRCSNDTCDRAFTAAESARAAKWWHGDGAPVAYMDMSPGCPDFIAAQSPKERVGA